MKLSKLSLISAIVLGFSGSVYAADTLADALKNGKVSGELKAWYWDKTVDSNGHSNNYNITNFGLELKYITDEINGFKGGVTFQSNATPFAEADAKVGYVNEEYASGSVLSEAYLEYMIGKTDIKVGRQYVQSPLIGGSGARIFRESFQGVTLVNNDLPDTTMYAYYFDKFQGRTSNISDDGVGGAPSFSDTFIVVYRAKTDGVYSAGIKNTSIPNLSLSGQYALLENIQMLGGLTSAANADDINIYFLETSYLVPMNDFKLKFDASYIGSRAGNSLDRYHMNGDMFQFRASLLELYGIGASIAYSTTSKNDDVIYGVGKAPTGTYTDFFMRGPTHVFEPGTDTYLAKAKYDLSRVGIKGLNAEIQYLNSKEDAPTVNTVSTNKGVSIDYEGFGYALNYTVPQIKGLALQLLYTTYDQDKTTALGTHTTTDTDELWFKSGYKF